MPVRLFSDFMGVLMRMYMYAVVPEYLAILHAVERMGRLGQHVEFV